MFLRFRTFFKTPFKRSVSFLIYFLFYFNRKLLVISLLKYKKLVQINKILFKLKYNSIPWIILFSRTWYQAQNVVFMFTNTTRNNRHLSFKCCSLPVGTSPFENLDSAFFVFAIKKLNQLSKTKTDRKCFSIWIALVISFYLTEG